MSLYVPTYGLETDQEALLDTYQHHTDKQVVGIDLSSISKMGGSLHCLTRELTGQHVGQLMESIGRSQ